MAEPAFDAALGRVPSGVFILTVGTGDRATGMLASWVMQAGFEPPTVSVAVKQGRYVCDWLTEGQPFVLNIVGDGQKEFLKHFAKGFEPGEQAFEGITISKCRTGVPMLTAAVAHLECEPAGHVDSGDHRVFLARVVRGGVADGEPGEIGPMVHIRKSGARY